MDHPLDRLPARQDADLVHVVVDTPKGSRNKYKYDAVIQGFRLGRILPAGACFPYDFGSIPRTLADDGDALDVMVLCDVPSFVGCVVAVKLIGAILGEQTEAGKTIRNDRLLAVAVTPANPAEITSIDQVAPRRLAEIEHFFFSYNLVHGRQYRPIARAGRAEAEATLRDAEKRYEDSKRP